MQSIIISFSIFTLLHVSCGKSSESGLMGAVTRPMAIEEGKRKFITAEKYANELWCFSKSDVRRKSHPRSRGFEVVPGTKVYLHKYAIPLIIFHNTIENLRSLAHGFFFYLAHEARNIEKVLDLALGPDDLKSSPIRAIEYSHFQRVISESVNGYNEYRYADNPICQ